MKMKMKKYCDRCLKKGYHKRFFIGIQFPFYDYNGFDLCLNCENELNFLFKEFMEKPNFKDDKPKKHSTTDTQTNKNDTSYIISLPKNRGLIK